jgi:hypothetical protein
MPRHRFVVFTAALAIAGVAAVAATRRAAPPPVAVALIDTAVLAAPRLGESSGVTASRRSPGVYWSHNDSGDQPFLYATDSAGTDLGRVRVRGARNVDWEDIATGPCFRTRETCLYISDSGDNLARRPWIVVYRLVEPAPPAGPSDTLRTVPLLDSLVLRYPDRPRDAEGLAITPDGWLLLVSKDRNRPPHLYRARIPRLPVPIVLEDRGSVPITFSLIRGRIVTGADASASGRLFVARTYVSIHLFRLENGEITPLLPEDGVTIPILEDQGEAVAFVGDSLLVLTSERALRNHAIVQRLLLTGVP